MEQTISSDFIRGHIDTIILRSLFSGTKHALEIAAFIEEKSGNKYEVKQATLYSALKRLEKLKYVRPFWNDAPEGGRRRYFEITPAGKAFADKNLSEWDYSRDVIDQLVDEVPKNIVHEPGVVLTGKSNERKTDKYAATDEESSAKKADLSEVREKREKTDYAPVLREEQKSSAANTFESQKSTVESSNKEIGYEQERNTSKNKPEETKDPALERILNTQSEINYREVLNDLLEKNIKKHTETYETTTHIQENTEPDTEPLTEPKYNPIRRENVFDKDFRIKSQNTGKTDFSDLLEKADAEGYKIRVSTGKNEKIGGKFLINRINLTSALAVFLVFLIECLLFSLIYKQDELFSGWLYLLFIAIAAVLPISQIVLYIKEPLKTRPSFNKNLIYTVLIILFNLLLIVIALALLTNTDFTSRAEIAYKIVAPVLILFDVFLFFFFRNLCVHSEYFITKK